MIICYHLRYVSFKKRKQNQRHLGIIWRIQTTMLCVDLPEIRIQPLLLLASAFFCQKKPCIFSASNLTFLLVRLCGFGKICKLQ